MTTPATLEGNLPRNMAGLRGAWAPHPRWTLDGFLRYMDQVPAQQVPAYVELNLRSACRLLPSVELALIGQNLLDDSHPEFGANPATRSEIERSVLANLTWEWR